MAAAGVSVASRGCPMTPSMVFIKYMIWPNAGGDKSPTTAVEAAEESSAAEAEAGNGSTAMFGSGNALCVRKSLRRTRTCGTLGVLGVMGRLLGDLGVARPDASPPSTTASPSAALAAAAGACASGAASTGAATSAGTGDGASVAGGGTGEAEDDGRTAPSGLAPAAVPEAVPGRLPLAAAGVGDLGVVPSSTGAASSKRKMPGGGVKVWTTVCSTSVVPASAVSKNDVKTAFCAAASSSNSVGGVVSSTDRTESARINQPRAEAIE